jgi:hypothetical protein
MQLNVYCSDLSKFIVGGFNFQTFLIDFDRVGETLQEDGFFEVEWEF